MTREGDPAVVTVFVPGEPAPQGSVKGYVVAGHAKLTHDNGKTMPWRSAIQAEVLRVTGGQRIEFPGAEPVALDIEFIMPRRKSEPKRRTRPHTRKPDGDKLARSVGDALTGVVYRDDAQVVRMSWAKRTAESGELPGARITWHLAPGGGTRSALPAGEDLAGLPGPPPGLAAPRTDHQENSSSHDAPAGKANRPSSGESSGRAAARPAEPGRSAARGSGHR